jgi:hypothetical protein
MSNTFALTESIDYKRDTLFFLLQNPTTSARIRDMHKDLRKVIQALAAQMPQSSASLIIPAGETIEKAPYGHDAGRIHIFWSGSKDGFGGLWVSESDFEANTEPD